MPVSSRRQDGQKLHIPADFDFCDIHQHIELKDFWAVEVSGNWRIIFRFEDGAPCDVDLVDYH